VPVKKAEQTMSLFPKKSRSVLMRADDGLQRLDGNLKAHQRPVERVTFGGQIMKLHLPANVRVGAVSLWALLGLTITPASAQVFSTLHSFSGSYGQYLHAGPVIDSSRNLYATTNSGAEPVDLSALSSFRVPGLDRCGIHVQGSTTVINGNVGLGPQCRSDMRSGRIAIPFRTSRS